MKVLILTVLFAVVAGCHGYAYIIPASLSTPGICFYNAAVLPSGESQVPGVCQKTDCRVDGSILIEGCGAITLPNCTLIVDSTPKASYPDCCDMTYQCLDAEGNLYTKIWNQLYPNGKPVGKVADFKNALKLAQKVQASATPSGDSKVVQPFILQLLLI